MEFEQFHPTAFYNKDGASFLISEAVRGEGAYLLDSGGKRFMHGYSELGELAPRDIVSRAIYLEMKKSGTEYVHLDLRHLDPSYVKTRFANIHQACLAHGIDMTTSLVPVAPAAHYTIGGVRTGLSGETNIDGLFACGEVACTGVHGANRLASNSLLECVVFAKRAVDGANESSKSGNPVTGSGIDPDLLHISGSDEGLFKELRREASRIMNRHVGMVRNREGLEAALAELKTMTDSLDKLSGYYRLKLKMILEVSAIIARFSLLREETRGVHIREDFPGEDPGWRKHIILKKGEEPAVLPV